MSSSGGRPVDVEIARVGCEARRRVLPARWRRTSTRRRKDAASKGCGWPVATTHRRRSGVAVGLLRGRHDDRRRRQDPARLRLLRRAADNGAAIVLALATNTWHAYNDFGGPNLYTGGTTVSMQRPMSAGYLFKPPGKGRRVTGTGAPDPQNAAHVGYIQLNHLSGYAGSAGWPDWELPFIEWAEREGYEIGVVTNADLEEHPEVLDDASSVPLGRPRRVLVEGHARHRRGLRRPRRQRRVLLRQHVAVAGAPRGTTRRWSGTRASSRTTRSTRPTASTRSRRSGPTTSWPGPRTT